MSRDFYESGSITKPTSKRLELNFVFALQTNTTKTRRHEETLKDLVRLNLCYVDLRVS